MPRRSSRSPSSTPPSTSATPAAADGPAPKKKHYVVLVLGDVGRSPRMQYHTVSLANLPGATVSLVGYTGETCVAAVESHPSIIKRLIAPGVGRKLPRSLFLLVAPVKVAQQVLQLLWVLCVGVPAPDAILVQNPPSIPALAAVWLVSLLRGCVAVVDWHNLGYTVLAENSLHAAHPVVGVARLYERLFGTRLHAHLCVTKSFQGWLEREWGIAASVLYDKPPDFFCRTPLEARHDLFQRLRADFADVEEKAFGRRAAGPDETLFTRRNSRSGGIELHPDRPALLISSTSWTPDEDFSLLFDALVSLDKAWAAGTPLSPTAGGGGGGSSRRGRQGEGSGGRPSDYRPQLVVVVTGKGPERAMYEQRIAAMTLRHVTVKTMWLEAADYPLLLGAADLGVCLHTSTSNLDLPMKVVDMFGCGLPVCAVHFDCLQELVLHEHNGLVFRSKQELALQMDGLLQGFPTQIQTLARLARGVEDFQKCRWQENWDQCARPIFMSAERQPRGWLVALVVACLLAVVAWSAGGASGLLTVVGGRGVARD